MDLPCEDGYFELFRAPTVESRERASRFSQGVAFGASLGLREEVGAWRGRAADAIAGAHFDRLFNGFE